MNQQRFWGIIEKAASFEQDKKYEQLRKELSQCSTEDICRFNLFLGEYLCCAESPVSWFLCKLITGYASDDSELYFRLWLISLGKDRFLGALKNPDSIMEMGFPQGECGFEELMPLSYEVLCEKTADTDSLLEKYSLSVEEAAQICAGVEKVAFDWFEDSEALLSCAKVHAPGLYSYYREHYEA